jgi:hypothetical protein
MVATGMGYGIVLAVESLAGLSGPDSRQDDSWSSSPDSALPDFPPPGSVEADPPDPSSPPVSPSGNIEERILRVEMAQQQMAQFLTREDLEVELNQRFAVQDRAVQSLRSMVAHTDELLEQVIESVESMHIDA